MADGIESSQTTNYRVQWKMHLRQTWWASIGFSEWTWKKENVLHSGYRIKRHQSWMFGEFVCEFKCMVLQLFLSSCFHRNDVQTTCAISWASIHVRVRWKHTYNTFCAHIYKYWCASAPPCESVRLHLQLTMRKRWDRQTQRVKNPMTFCRL